MSLRIKIISTELDIAFRIHVSLLLCRIMHLWHQQSMLHNLRNKHQNSCEHLNGSPLEFMHSSLWNVFQMQFLDLLAPMERLYFFQILIMTIKMYVEIYILTLVTKELTSVQVMAWRCQCCHISSRSWSMMPYGVTRLRWVNVGLTVSYCQVSNISRTESQNLLVSRLSLQLSLCNILKPGVKLRMRISALLQLRLSDQFNCLLKCALYMRLEGIPYWDNGFMLQLVR